MKAMLDAIKSKRMGKSEGSDHAPTHPAQHAEDKGKDLHGLVASLSDAEKGQLKTILHADSADTTGIEKGGPSSDEVGEIDEAMAEENSANAIQAEKDESRHPKVGLSDDVAEAMVDHKAIAAMNHGQKPRNLGERARMQAAQGLKQKGKI